jgi:hypothetical protein
MRSDVRFDETVPSFTLICPGYRGAGAYSGASRNEGNLTFTIGSDVVAEIDHGDLLESWAAAEELSAMEAVKMSEKAADHLSEILEGGLPSGSLTEAVTDAAVVFLLAMKRSGISDPKRIPACTVMWNGHEGREHVVFGA